MQARALGAPSFDLCLRFGDVYRRDLLVHGARAVVH
jgi:hypothetical protein